MTPLRHIKFMKNKTKTANCNITEDAIQVILTGVVGDGSITRKSTDLNAYFTTACVYKDFIYYKYTLLGDLASSRKTSINHGYKTREIHSLLSRRHRIITEIGNNSLERNLKMLNDLGVALWFYDDGTLHKNSWCYHLCTHAFSLEEHQDLIIPFLQKYLDVKVCLASETKTDGRHFYYCRINKRQGAKNISDLLGKYPIDCYNYKRWEYMLQFDRYDNEIYIVDQGKLYGKIHCMERDNYYIVFEDDEVKIPEHTLNAAKDYVRKHYKEHTPID
jgi:hypothetical protein